jgi:hypothetical protein
MYLIKSSDLLSELFAFAELKPAARVPFLFDDWFHDYIVIFSP